MKRRLGGINARQFLQHFGRRSDQGSATILVAGVVLLMMACLAFGLAILATLMASLHARTAADNAALAGASAVLQHAADPCGPAAQIARENGAQLASCVVEGEQVLVAARVKSVMPGFGAVVVVHARAGPADSRATG